MSNTVSTYIDMLFIIIYYACYWKMVRRLNEEFKILDKINPRMDFQTYKDQLVKCYTHLLLVVLALIGLFILNTMVVKHLSY